MDEGMIDKKAMAEDATCRLSFACMWILVGMLDKNNEKKRGPACEVFGSVRGDGSATTGRDRGPER